MDGWGYLSVSQFGYQLHDGYTVGFLRTTKPTGPFVSQTGHVAVVRTPAAGLACRLSSPDCVSLSPQRRSFHFHRAAKLTPTRAADVHVWSGSAVLL